MREQVVDGDNAQGIALVLAALDTDVPGMIAMLSGATSEQLLKMAAYCALLAAAAITQYDALAHDDTVTSLRDAILT